jgi:hypothetical protein
MRTPLTLSAEATRYTGCPATGVTGALVVVSVPETVNFWLTATEVRLAATESCVGIVVTCTVTTLLMALAYSPLAAVCCAIVVSYNGFVFTKLVASRPVGHVRRHVVSRALLVERCRVMVDLSIPPVLALSVPLMVKFLARDAVTGAVAVSGRCQLASPFTGLDI